MAKTAKANASDDPGDLQLEQDLVLQQRTWRVQRIGWVVLALIVLCGTLGLFGGIGPLNSTSTQAADGSMVVHYPRFGRYVGPTEFAIELPATRASGGTIELALERAYLDQWEMYGISPQPDGEKAVGDWMVYEFSVGEAAMRIDFHGRPHTVGWLRGRVRVGDGEPVALATWVHP